MAGTREISRRIKSVKNIGQITKAMELVSASKMRRSQEAAVGGRRYSQTLHTMLANLVAHTTAEHHPLLQQSEQLGNGSHKVLMIVFSPDKGLCGGLISNVLREIQQFGQTHPHVTYVTMGKRGRDGVIRMGGEVLADFPLHDRSQLRHVLPLTKVAINAYLHEGYQEVIIAHTRFINILVQKPFMHQILPLSMSIEKIESENSDLDSEFLFEPSVEAVLEQLLPRYVEMTIYQALLEAQASEHSARMVAMKNAGDNARDIQDELTLTKNQLRQASITAELAEISSGAAA